MVDFIVEECKEKGGLSAKPKNPIHLDLKKISAQYKTLLETPILIVIEEQGEIVVHNYGELLFKDLKDENKIRTIAQKIYEVSV